MIGMRKPIALCVLAASFAMAQDAAPLAFEVASVKVNTTGEKPGGDSKGGRLTLYNIPLRVLVALASSVANDKVAGPGWIDTEGYDIVLADGTHKQFKLAVRNDNPPRRWLQDGGF